MATKPKLTPPQRALLAEIKQAGTLYITRWGRYYRTADALVSKGYVVLSVPDHSRNGQDGYSASLGPKDNGAV